MRPTRLEVDIHKFLENVNQIQKYVEGKQVMPVLKANAYGTYINSRINIIRKFPIVAVALVDEGVSLRKIGYCGDILILNQPSKEEIPMITENSLTVGLSEISFLESCIQENASFPIHIEIETGMNRTGVPISQLENFLDALKKSKLQVKGIYSHFSSADCDRAYTEKQIDLFKTALEIASKKEMKFQYIHISASNGLLNYKLPFTNLVRPGILLYGYEPYKDSNKTLPVQPICALKTEITFLKKVKKGEAISYSQNYVCEKDSLIATIPIGYGDGYRRCLSNKGYVVIHGKKARIVGNICMDSCMIDVSEIDCQIGDTVNIIEEQTIPLDIVAEECETINYEILCTIGERVPRVFIGESYE